MALGGDSSRTKANIRDTPADRRSSIRDRRTVSDPSARRRVTVVAVSPVMIPESVRPSTVWTV